MDMAMAVFQMIIMSSIYIHDNKSLIRNYGHGFKMLDTNNTNVHTFIAAWQNHFNSAVTCICLQTCFLRIHI